MTYKKWIRPVLLIFGIGVIVFMLLQIPGPDQNSHDHESDHDHDHSGNEAVHTHTDADLSDHVAQDHGHAHGDEDLEHDHSDEDSPAHGRSDYEPGHLSFSEAVDHDHADSDNDHLHESGDSDHDPLHDIEDSDHDSGDSDHDHLHESGDSDHDHTEESSSRPEDDHRVPALDDHEHSPDEDVSHETGSVIEADNEWESLIGLKTEPVLRKSLELTLSVPGRIVADPDRRAVISPFIEAGVNCVFAKEGDTVKKGTVLACLTSPELGNRRAEYDKTKAELEIERQQFTRKKDLYAENILSKKGFEDAQLKIKVAEVNYNFARSRLLALGITEADVDQPPTAHTDAVGSTMHITSPIDGIITHRQASIGQKVNAGNELFEILDLDVVWLEADLFEKDLSKIELQQKVKLALPGGQEGNYQGRIFHIGNTVDARKRTVKMLAAIDNATHELRPGMFTTALIVLQQKQNALVVPKSSVLDDSGVKYVFVKESLGYHRHNVETGVVDGDSVEILHGLESGAQVVTQGGYQLKSKARMGTVDPHAGHVH